jgi:hypothetical protein
MKSFEQLQAKYLYATQAPTNNLTKNCTQKKHCLYSCLISLFRYGNVRCVTQFRDYFIFVLYLNSI